MSRSHVMDCHTEPVNTTIVEWFSAHSRDLPWRSPQRTPWGVYVSEFMLQQTPVDRVLPRWHDWLTRWPTPAALADSTVGDALRHWDRLGYPRRAKWLHEGATLMVANHGGGVPSTYESLRALPGVGDYTANAVLAFAFGRRSVVLDTNVRRVLARLDGEASAPGSVTVAERQRAEAHVPAGDADAAVWSAAVMEFGALVCTARNPACDVCPVRGSCDWAHSGYPDADKPTSRPQKYVGTDRYVRGLLMARLRESAAPVPRSALESVWADALQRERCLDSLVADGLVEPLDGSFALPG